MHRPERPTAVLICHHDEPLNRFGLARWMASWTNLAAIVVICEPVARKRRRVRRELARVGFLRILDVVAFRIYHRLLLSRADRAAERAMLHALQQRYPEIPPWTRILEVSSPNSQEVRDLLSKLRPTFMIARCKSILRQDIFAMPAQGTFVMHPGICPEYRNAHGCFWALANRDLQKVGMTLLRVDAGVDTGAIYGYFTYDFDERRESHDIIQERVVFDNLDAIRETFELILNGHAHPLDTSGRNSRSWGQPWLTKYSRWKRDARARR
jgi:folate-dependent phosphoribosylglycinamide formyltransferase PurN